MPPKPATSKRKTDVEALLSDLDNLGTKDKPTSGTSTPVGTNSSNSNNSNNSNNNNTGSNNEVVNSRADATAAPKANNVTDAQSLLDDLDSLVQQRRAAPTPKQSKKRSQNTQSQLQQQQPSGQDTSPSTPSIGAAAAKDPIAAQAPVTPSSLAPQAPTSPFAASPSLTASNAAAAAAATGGDAVMAASIGQPVASAEHQQQQQSGGGGGGGGAAAPWTGWGSVWSQATKFADQARLELEKRAKEAAAAAQAQGHSVEGAARGFVAAAPKGWGGFAQGVRGWAKEAGLDKIGQEFSNASRQLVNAVAPPIAAHEVIEVQLSHDMIGYDGVSDVVFRVLQIVMERQVDPSTEQQLIVNTGPAPPRASGDVKAQSAPSREAPENGTAGAGVEVKAEEEVERDLRAVEGFESGWKLAESTLDELVASQSSALDDAASRAQRTPASATNPVTRCPVFIRLQPVIAALPGSGALEGRGQDLHQLWFLAILRDPINGLGHRACSQGVPRSWLDVPYEQSGWVEQSLVDQLEGALSVLAQDYVNGRQTGAKRGIVGVGGADHQADDDAGGRDADEKVVGASAGVGVTTAG